MNLQRAIVKVPLLICLFLSLGLSAPAVAQTGYKTVSVCDVLRGTLKHDQREVEVDAVLFIARPHGVVLVDQQCPAKGLALDFPTQGEDGSVANLEKLIRNGELPMESTGRFCGKITRDPKTKRPVLSLRLVLDLQPKSGPTTLPNLTEPIEPGKTFLHESGHVDPPKQP
jgi:hypothetical protein